MSEIAWIKLKTEMFDDPKIKVIQSMPEGDSLLVIWIRLMTLAGTTNDNGYIYLTPQVPYTEEMLTVIFNRPLAIVRLALDTFTRLGMLEQDAQGIYLVNFSKHQALDKLSAIKEKNKTRQQRYRENQRLLAQTQDTENIALPGDVTGDVTVQSSCDVTGDVTAHVSCNATSDKCHVTPNTHPNVNGNVTRNVTRNAAVTSCHAVDKDKELDKDLEKESEKDLKTLKPPLPPTQTLQGGAGGGKGEREDLAVPKDEASDTLAGVFRKILGRRASTYELETLMSYQGQGLDFAVIEKALQDTADNGVKHLGYTKAILNRCVREGLVTLPQYTDRQKSRKFKATKEEYDGSQFTPQQPSDAELIQLAYANALDESEWDDASDF